LEIRLADCGMGLVAGVDEAGRGPLAGPVVASAVILDRRTAPEGINDSKKLCERARARLFDAIRSTAVAVGVGVVSPEVVDRSNIVGATLEAMTTAVRSLGVAPDCVVVDGKNLPQLSVPTIALVQGDARCLSVAAASIIAKVTRDRIMREMDEVYPHYAFARNKGYGTRDHLEALRRYGPSKIHRFSFAPVSALMGATGGR
jgi:ribonuclease HII